MLSRLPVREPALDRLAGVKTIYVVTCVQISAEHFYVARAFTSDAQARGYAASQMEGLRTYSIT